jgi:DNA repair protein RadC
MAKSIYCVGRKSGQQLEMRVCEKSEGKMPAKRVNIVSIKLVRESSVLYSEVRKICSPSDAAILGRRFLEDADREQLIVCCLDTKNQPQSINVASIGSLNSSIAHPREIFKTAILSNAASIIIMHNHPSGDPSQSQEDVNITKRLKEAGKIIGIELLDHIIIGSEGKYCSLKEEGIL